MQKILKSKKLNKIKMITKMIKKMMKTFKKEKIKREILCVRLMIKYIIKGAGICIRIQKINLVEIKTGCKEVLILITQNLMFEKII